MRTLESEVASPYVINEIKPYLKLGDLGQLLCVGLLQQREIEKKTLPENICPGKLVEVSGCKVYPVTVRCVKPAIVVTHTVLSENAKSGMTQDFPYCYKYVDRSKVYDSCKFHGSNIMHS